MYWTPQLGQTLILDLREDQELEAKRLLRLLVVATIDITASHEALIAL